MKEYKITLKREIVLIAEFQFSAHNAEDAEDSLLTFARSGQYGNPESWIKQLIYEFKVKEDEFSIEDIQEIEDSQ